MLEFYVIFAAKIIRIPDFLWHLPAKLTKFPKSEFYMIFARNTLEFYMIIALKNIFPELLFSFLFLFFFGGGGCTPLAPRLLRLWECHWLRTGFNKYRPTSTWTKCSASHPHIFGDGDSWPPPRGTQCTPVVHKLHRSVTQSTMNSVQDRHSDWPFSVRQCTCLPYISVSERARFPLVSGPSHLRPSTAQLRFSVYEPT